jgi:hypothetical protein
MKNKLLLALSLIFSCFSLSVAASVEQGITHGSVVRLKSDYHSGYLRHMNDDQMELDKTISMELDKTISMELDKTSSADAFSLFADFIIEKIEGKKGDPIKYGDTVTLKSQQNNYVSVKDDDGDVVKADTPTATNNAEQFIIELEEDEASNDQVQAGHLVVFKSLRSNMYLSYPAGKDIVIANKGRRGRRMDWKIYAKSIATEPSEMEKQFIGVEASVVYGSIIGLNLADTREPLNIPGSSDINLWVIKKESGNRSEWIRVGVKNDDVVTLEDVKTGKNLSFDGDNVSGGGEGSSVTDDNKFVVRIAEASRDKILQVGDSFDLYHQKTGKILKGTWEATEYYYPHSNKTLEAGNVVRIKCLHNNTYLVRAEYYSAQMFGKIEWGFLLAYTNPDLTKLHFNVHKTEGGNLQFEANPANDSIGQKNKYLRFEDMDDSRTSNAIYLNPPGPNFSEFIIEDGFFLKHHVKGYMNFIGISQVVSQALPLEDVVAELNGRGLGVQVRAQKSDVSNNYLKQQIPSAQFAIELIRDEKVFFPEPEEAPIEKIGTAVRDEFYSGMVVALKAYKPSLVDGKTSLAEEGNYLAIEDDPKHHLRAVGTDPSSLSVILDVEQEGEMYKFKSSKLNAYLVAIPKDTALEGEIPFDVRFMEEPQGLELWKISGDSLDSVYFKHVMSNAYLTVIENAQYLDLPDPTKVAQVREAGEGANLTLPIRQRHIWAKFKVKMILASSRMLQEAETKLQKLQADYRSALLSGTLEDIDAANKLDQQIQKVQTQIKQAQEAIAPFTQRLQDSRSLPFDERVKELGYLLPEASVKGADRKAYIEELVTLVKQRKPDQLQALQKLVDAARRDADLIAGEEQLKEYMDKLYKKAGEEKVIVSFKDKVDKTTALPIAERVNELKKLITQAVRSDSNREMYLNAIEELVKSRTPENLDQIQELVNFAKFNTELVGDVPARRMLLDRLSEVAETPVTPAERIQDLQRKLTEAAAIPEKKEAFLKQTDGFMSDLESLVGDRGGMTDEDVVKLQTLVQTARFNPLLSAHSAELQALLDAMSKPVTFAENLNRLAARLSSGKATENDYSKQAFIRRLPSFVDTVLDQKKQGISLMGEDKRLEELLKSVKYNFLFTERQRQQVSDLLEKLGVKIEAPVELPAAPDQTASFGEKVNYFFGISSKKFMKNPESKQAYLAGIEPLIQQALMAAPQEREKLADTLSFVAMFDELTEQEKKKVKDLQNKIKVVSTMKGRIDQIIKDANTAAVSPENAAAFLNKVQMLIAEIEKAKAEGKTVEDISRLIPSLNFAKLQMSANPALVAQVEQLDAMIKTLSTPAAPASVAAPEPTTASEPKPEPAPAARGRGRGDRGRGR